jgi:uncharacterized protein
MGLIRLLTFLLILWVLWFMYRNYQTRQQRKNQSRRIAAGRIVKCRHCEVHLPQQQALAHGNDWFCSPAHKQAFLGDDRQA